MKKSEPVRCVCGGVALEKDIQDAYRYGLKEGEIAALEAVADAYRQAAVASGGMWEGMQMETWKHWRQKAEEAKERCK